MTETTQPSEERPLRRDAERNRQRILDAARVVFAERGLRGSHDDIAREAGVGVGTVYRRFPDKDQLIEALFEDRMEEFAAFAAEAAAYEDPWEGIVAFLEGSLALQTADRGLKELVMSSDRGTERIAQARARVQPYVDALLARAKAAGAVRSDLELTDLALVQIAIGSVSEATHDIAPDVWRRMLALVLPGLRPGAPAMAAEPLTLEQFDAAMQASHAAVAAALSARRRAPSP